MERKLFSKHTIGLVLLAIVASFSWRFIETYRVYGNLDMSTIGFPSKPSEKVNDTFLIHLENRTSHSRIIIGGMIDNGFYNEFTRVLGEATSKNILIALSSPGGRIIESHYVILKLKELKAMGYKITTLVPNESRCFSACVPIFMAGDNRISDENAMFMFHSLRLKDNIFNSFISLFEEKVIEYNRRNFFYYFVDVDKTWLEDRVKDGTFSMRNDYYITGLDACEKKTNITTFILKGEHLKRC